VISARYLHVFSIRSRFSRSTRRSRGKSPLLPRHRRGLFFGYIPLETREHSLLFSRRSRCRGLWARNLDFPSHLFRRFSFVRYFSSGTLPRQSYSPAFSPTRTAVSFNLAALYRDSFTAVFLRLRYSVLSPRHARLESVLRRQFTTSPGYTRAVLYIAGQRTLQDRAMPRIPVERSLRFIGPILETFYVVSADLVELICCHQKEKEEKKTLYFLDLKSLSFYLALEILYDGCSVNSLEFVHVQDVRSSAIASFNVRIQEAGNLAARLLVGFFAREGNFPFG